jgi:hypothetical protein
MTALGLGEWRAQDEQTYDAVDQTSELSAVNACLKAVLDHLRERALLGVAHDL